MNQSAGGTTDAQQAPTVRGLSTAAMNLVLQAFSPWLKAEMLKL
jgi:hypothetical protein